MGFPPEPKGFTGASPLKGRIRVGPAGWSYRDWSGIVYPKTRPSGFQEAGFLARFFDVLEINTSFYRAVPAATAAKWVRQVAHNPHFRFTAKLHQSFTHQGSKHFGNTRPGGAGLANIEPEEAGFREMADALAREDRLGAVLAQFSWSFRNTAENRDYLAALLERFREYPMVVETRHSSWDDPGYFALLQEKHAGFCNIDQPVIGKSLAPSARTTSQVGYVRLHGRNYKDWFSESGRDARYDYLYAKEELESWKLRTEQVARDATSTYVITNNHYQGQAAANALELISLLVDGPVPAPDSLVASYPRLRGCTVTEQQRLPLA